MSDGDLTLLIGGSSSGTGTPVTIKGGKRLQGWTDIRVTRGIERCPSDFELGMTERYPGEAHAFVTQPGDRAQVLIGDDVVLTGYLDALRISLDAGSHELRLAGRGKCADLVDCAADWPNGQLSAVSVLKAAKDLAQPYGVTVTGLVDTGAALPQLNINKGETVYSVIETLCRYRALVAYEQFDGSLVITQALGTRAATAIVEGKNVQRATVDYRMDQRFSEYRAEVMSLDTLHDAGEGGFLIGSIKDTGVPRFRLRYVIAEAAQGGNDVALRRAQWECNRRIGRSMVLRVTVDSWRDGAGKLWEPNTLVPLNLPSLKLVDEIWLLGEVTYRLGSGGTQAELTLMPPGAFDPNPIALPAYGDVPALPPGTRADVSKLHITLAPR